MSFFYPVPLSGNILQNYSAMLLSGLTPTWSGAEPFLPHEDPSWCPFLTSPPSLLPLPPP